MLRLTLLFGIMMLLAALPARADEVRLKNGDRLTGETVSLANGTLTFKTAVGELRIPWGDVTSLAVDKAVFVTVGSNPPILTAFAAADSIGYVTLMAGGRVLLTDIAALTPQLPAWEAAGGAGAGIVQTAGNTQVNSLRGSGDFTLKGPHDRYTATAVATYAKDRGVETARNWSATGKYDRFLTSRFFANVNAVFTNDRFRDIDLRSAAGAGVGLQLIDVPRAKLTVSGGVGLVDENFISIADDRYTAAYESAGLQVQLVPGRAELFHSHDGYFEISKGDKKFFRTQSGIRFSLAAGFVATIQEDVDYDRRPSPGRRQTDRTFSLTLGYQF